MYYRSILILIALSCQLVYAQKITLDESKKLYGIKDKNNKWLTLPIYKHIEEVYGKDADDNKVLFYHAKTKTKHVLLNKNGITKLSADYDSIGLTANPNVLIYKNGANYYRGASMNFIPSEKNKFIAAPLKIDPWRQYFLIKNNSAFTVFDAEKNEIILENIENADIVYGNLIFRKKNKWYHQNNPDEKYDTIYKAIAFLDPDIIVKQNNTFRIYDSKISSTDLLTSFDCDKLIINDGHLFIKKNGKFTVNKLFAKENEKDVKLVQVIKNEFDTILGLSYYGFFLNDEKDVRSSIKLIGIVNEKMVHVRLEDGLEIVPLKYKYIRPVCEGCIDKDENRLYFVTNDFNHRKDTFNTFSFELKKLNYTYGISNCKGELIVPIEGKPLPVYTDFEPKSHFGDSIQSNFDAKDSSFMGIVWLKNAMIKYQENGIKYNYKEAFDNDGNFYKDSVKSIRYSIFPENGTASIIHKNGAFITPWVEVNNISFNFKPYIHQEGQSETHLQSLNNYTVTSKERETKYSDINPGIYVSPHTPVFYKEKYFIGACTWDGKKIIPPSLDSIAGMNIYGFKAYKKGFCTYFKYNAKDYLFESDLCFPDLNKSEYSLLCKNCDFEYIKLKKSRIETGIDQWGYETEYKDTVTQNLPKIRAGKFNLVNGQFEKLLPEWVDEILFPIQNENNYFNSLNSQKDLTNKIIESSLEDIISDINKHGFAIRVNQNWNIRDVSGNKTINENFDSVSFKDGKWICKKGNNITEYNSNEFSN